MSKSSHIRYGSKVPQSYGELFDVCANRSRGNPEKRCLYCTSILIQRPREYWKEFERRRYCNQTCSGKAVIPKRLEWIRVGECIQCTSHKASGGYIIIRRDGKDWRVSRLILTKRLGQLKPSIVARHTCDNTWCINPSHIISGTQIDNIQDRVIRGRGKGARGCHNPSAKLTPERVLIIRSVTESAASLARKFGVSKPCVLNARNRKTWLHV